MQPYVIPFQSLGIADIPEVGGKNASLGEMISNLSSSGVHVPGGFATTAQAYPMVTAWNTSVKLAEDAVASALASIPSSPAPDRAILAH